MRSQRRKLISSVITGLFLVNLVFASLFLSDLKGNGGTQATRSKPPNPQAAAMSDPLSWWDAKWDYRVRVEVNNSNADSIKETPLEKRINFTQLLEQVGDPKRLDNKSIRVVEYTQSGTWVEMRSRWNATEDTANLLNCTSIYYDEYDIFDVVWTLNGTTQANQNRTFYIYFNSRTAAPVGLPDYRFDAVHLNYVDYRKIADFSSGAMTVNDPWDREYWTLYSEWLKDEYTATQTGNTTFDPIINDLNYEGWVHQYMTSSGRQTHVGETNEIPSGYRFPIQWNVPNRWFITEYPILTITMRVNDATALTSLYILTSLGGWSVVGYTPNSKNTQGGYDSGVDKVNGFEIICDGQWHTYAYDLRRISLSTSVYVTCIEMYQNNWVGSAHNIWMDNIFFYKSSFAEIDSLYSKYNRTLPTTWVGQAQVKSAILKVQCVDVDGNPLPNANVTLVNSSNWAMLNSNLTNSAGYATFSELSFGNYSFNVTLHSNVLPGIYCSVNSTVRFENKTIDTILPEVTLHCTASRTVFTLVDVNGNPVESGWVLVGNESAEYWPGLQNVSIGADGKAYFYWYNTTPYTDFKYNYTVYYQNTSYRETSSGLDTIILHAGTIDFNNRKDVTLWTSLTTHYFTVLSDIPPFPPISGAAIRITNSSSGKSVVNLTMDEGGKAVFRWLIANETGGNSNYTFEIYFFGVPKSFNYTLVPDYSDSMNATLNLTQYWEFRAIIDPSSFQTALVSVVPGGFIETEWGQEIHARVLFNVTKNPTGSEGPAWASNVNYQVKSGEQVVLAGAFSPIPYYLGWYEAIINSSLLTGGVYYSMYITGAKSGYTIPDSLSLPISVTSVPSQLTKTSGSSTMDTWWNDTQPISVDFTTLANERITIQNIFSKMAMSGDLSLWDLQNNWNLTKVVFNFNNVFWDEDISGTNPKLNITGPDGFSVVDLSNAKPLEGIDLWHANVRELVYEKIHGNMSNSYTFTVGGNFDNAISGNLTAYFVRNQVNATFKTQVAASDTSLSIKRFESGWSIKYLNITLSDLSPFNLGDIKIRLPTGVTKDVIPCGNLGCLEFLDIDLYPSNESWVFGLTTDRSFTATIIAGMQQVVAVDSQLETTYFTQGVSGITNSSTLSVNLDGNQFTYNPGVLRVTNLTSAGGLVLPSTVNLQVVINGVQYIFGDSQSPGESSITLSSLPRKTLLSYVFSSGQNVYFNITLEQEVTRTITSTTTGTITYSIQQEPSVFGSFNSVTGVTGRYAVNFYTGVLEARRYTFQIRSYKANYATAALDLELNIIALPTAVGTYGNIETLDFIYNDQINVTYGRNYTLYLLDTHNTQPVLGASATYTWRRLNATSNTILATGTSAMRDDGNGFYTLDFITRNTLVGKYTFLISFIKSNYETRSAYIEVNVQLKVIAFELVGFVEGGIVKKPQGESILIAIDLKDVAAGNIALSGAVVELYFNGAWRNMTADNTTAGRYTYTIDTSSGFDTLFAPKDFLAKIRVILGNYTIGQAEIAFTIVVSQPEYLGIPTIYWIIAMVAIGAVVGIFVSIKLIQRARIPQIIKDISATRDLIKKRRAIDEIAISPTKAELVHRLVEGEWAIIGVDLPAPGTKKVEESRSVPEEIEHKEASG